MKRVRLYSLHPQVLITLVAVTFGAWGIWPEALQAKQAFAPAMPHRVQVLDSLVPTETTLPPVDCSDVPCLAISFDDGPDPTLTPRVLDILARHNARASFFVIGVYATKHPDIVRRIYQDGHEVGNHSWNHPNLTKMSPSDIESQVTLTQQAVMSAGVPAPRLFRPPYGAINDVVRAHVPLALAMWNIDPEDWHQKDPVKITEHIEAHVKPGAVIDMHDTHPQAVEALEMTLQKFQGRYQFVTVSELFDIPAGQRGEFYGR